MGSSICSINLGSYLGFRGVNRNERMQAWSRAGVEARSRMPTCEAITARRNMRCGCSPIRGFRYCRHHLRGLERTKAIAELEIRHRKLLGRGDTPIREERARRGLASIAATKLRRIWGRRHLGDAMYPGTTLNLTPAQEQLVITWLQENCGVDLEGPHPHTGRSFSPRALDRLRHSAWRAVKRRNIGMSTTFQERIKQCVEAAMRDEQLWWRRWGDDLDDAI